LRTGAWGKKAEHAAQHEQHFRSAEFEAAVHRVKKQVTSPEVTCGTPNFLMQNTRQVLCSGLRRRLLPPSSIHFQCPGCGLAWPKVQCGAGRWDIGLSCWREV
jgi:hypothetical protein